MAIYKALLCVGGMVAWANPANAADTPTPFRDTYIISRDANSTFLGSHKLYSRMSDGLVEVSYCDRSYWVRYATVAWTQLESGRGHAVQIEFNRGKGWRPICSHPEDQVNLKGLGIAEDPRVVIQNDGAQINRINRFTAIRQFFKPGTDTAGSTDN